MKSNDLWTTSDWTKYLWAVRVFKTRSDAADAVPNNKVTVNSAYAKPSREVKIGDVIAVRRMQVTYSYKVPRPRVEPPSGQERSPVLPQRHAAGGAGQTQRSARDRLRIRDRGTGHRPPEGAPRAGRPDGRELYYDEGRRTPAAKAATCRQRLSAAKTSPKAAGRPFPPTARRSALRNHAAFAASIPHGAISTAKLPKRQDSCGIHKNEKPGPFRASTKARFPFHMPAGIYSYFSATSC